ncbi:MAG: hypothetical protein ABFD50_17835 [Smithella sp.]
MDEKTKEELTRVLNGEYWNMYSYTLVKYLLDLLKEANIEVGK